MAHIERALDHELANIKNLLTSMGGKVQYMLENSTKALVERDTRLAEEIIQFDKEVDRLELVIDQAIYELIALRQPAAGDLRMVLAGIKINNDLERMGDYCEGVCRQAISLNKMPALPQTKEFEKLAMLASRMLGDCISAYINNDIAVAKKTILADDEVDDLARLLIDSLHLAMRTDPANVAAASALVLVASKLERIADQATNISEEVVFSVTGDNIRHRSYAFAVGDEE